MYIEMYINVHKNSKTFYRDYDLIRKDVPQFMTAMLKNETTFIKIL